MLKKRYLSMFFFVIISSLLFSGTTVTVRTFDHKDYSRLVLQSDTPFQYRYNKSGDKEWSVEAQGEINWSKSDLKSKKISIKKQNKGILVAFNKNVAVKRNFVLEKPFRVVFDFVDMNDKKIKTESKKIIPKRENIITQDKPLNNNNSTINKDNKKTNDLGKPKFAKRDKSKKYKIKTICLDPGHGGSDFGAIGKNKTLEKDVVLNITRILKKLIEKELGIRVIMTRNSDVEVALDTRAAMANNQKADIFVSVHCNASFRRIARGPETFYVSLKASDMDSYELAKRENNSSLQKQDNDKTEKKDDLDLILWNMSQNEYIKESSKLADYIQARMNNLMHTKNRGVKQAPFRVLMRSAMPAVLVEVAFISNPEDEKQLSTQDFCKKIANTIFKGIKDYIEYAQYI